MLGFSTVAQTPLCTLPGGGTDFPVAVNVGATAALAVSFAVAKSATCTAHLGATIVLATGKEVAVMTDAVGAILKAIAFAFATSVIVAGATFKGVGKQVAVLIASVAATATPRDVAVLIAAGLGAAARAFSVFSGRRRPFLGTRNAGQMRSLWKGRE